MPKSIYEAIFSWMFLILIVFYGMSTSPLYVLFAFILFNLINFVIDMTLLKYGMIETSLKEDRNIRPKWWFMFFIAPWFLSNFITILYLLKNKQCTTPKKDVIV